MSFKTDLNLMRKEWYNAFYTGNVDQLDYLETEWFISTNGQKVIYKKHQLRKVNMRSAEQKNLSLTRREYDVEIREFKGIACVSGKAALDSDDDTAHIGFIEN
ncbi:MAG: hypothetical protein XXXJIFNMEKO3_LKCDNKCA_00136 (plasmid) [Candidatus Erwinia impunctatus]